MERSNFQINKEKIVPPQSWDDFLKLLEREYNQYYRRPDLLSDSPEVSRIRLRQRLGNKLKDMLEIGGAESEEKLLILNIGSGKQWLEKEFQHAYKDNTILLSRVRFVSLDVADIYKKHLLTHNKNKKYLRPVSHVRASATELPFAKASFHFVISNLAIDFLPPDVLQEVRCVLKSGGVFLANFHCPDLLSEYNYASKDQGTQLVWNFLRENKVLYDSEASIIERLANYGLLVRKVELFESMMEKWWEVEAQKQ